MTNYHLVVLVHGLWGNVSHFDYIRKELQASAKATALNKEENQLVVYTTCLNEGFKTYDGIDICGFRVAKEISEQIEEFESLSSNTNDRITKFSMVGYSLGGLIARYSLGVLHKTQFFKKREIELLNFTTFCTPHVGVLAPGHNFAVKMFNSTVPWLLGNSGKQIFLKDSISSNSPNGTHGNLPLIYLMSLESSVFYKALESFKYKSLYANIINDKRTAWWTSGISLNDPFFNINEYNGVDVFQYVDGYQTVVVNRNNPILISKIPACEDDEDSSPKNSPEEKSSSVDAMDDKRKFAGEDFYFLNYWFIKIGKWIIVMVNLLIIAPLFLLWKIVQSGTEMTISTIRVTRFVNRFSHQLLHDFFDISPAVIMDSDNNIIADDDEIDRDEDFYSLNPTVSRSSSIISNNNNGIPQDYNNYLAFEGSLNDQAENLMESIYDAIERKNTHAGFLEEAPSLSGSIDSKYLAVTIRELEDTSVEELTAKHGPEYRDLIKNLFLDLPQSQLDIIKSLNKINWEKYPIYIRNTPSSHACAIVRQIDPNFQEGEIVIKHWIDQVFRRS